VPSLVIRNLAYPIHLAFSHVEVVSDVGMVGLLEMLNAENTRSATGSLVCLSVSGELNSRCLTLFRAPSGVA